MKKNQRTQGLPRRLMYVENKDGLIDGEKARIGWVTFSKTGRTIYYRDLALLAIKGGIRGNFLHVDTQEEFWVSGVKKRGSNAHPYEPVTPVVDEDAKEAYEQVRAN